MLKSILLSATIAVFLCTAALGQSKDETAVANAVESLRKAMIDPTKEALDKLAADELSYGHSSGKLEDKAAFMDALLAKRSDFVSIDLTEQTIKVAGNTAIVRHTLSASTNDNGNPGTVKIGVMLVWQKQKNDWKLLARQAFRFPQQ
jgi:ketosteroid isomerase-like protein